MSDVVFGYGFVGKATELLLSINDSTVQIHDPAQGMEVSDWGDTKFGFICVPTPEDDEGKLDLTAVTECYELCLQHNITPVIRSTLGPDQVPLFPQAVMMPEFLREAHWENDTHRAHTVILGSDTSVPTLLRMRFWKKQLVITGGVDAMMYKLARNAMLASKVVLANQLNEVCNNTGADYDRVVGLLLRDNTLGMTHWDVPGPDGQFGFGGKCFPKDVSHISRLCTDKLHNIFKYVSKLNSKFRNK